MHIVDAKGADGEGVGIGKGDVDFLALFQLLNQVNPDIPFIPEVWQGHKNGGEGFWSALDFLESCASIRLLIFKLFVCASAGGNSSFREHLHLGKSN